MKVVFSNLSRRQAMVTEQTLISTYVMKRLGGELDNRRREIARGKLPNFKDDLGDIIEIFQGIREDEILNLMEQ